MNVEYSALIELGVFMLIIHCSTESYPGDPEVFRVLLWIASELRDSEARIQSSVNSMLKYIALVVSDRFWSLWAGCWFIISDVNFSQWHSTEINSALQAFSIPRQIAALNVDKKEPIH